MVAHPTIKQLELLAHGQLDEPQATPIRSHLSDCTDCRQQHDECLCNQAWEEDLRRALEDQVTRRWSSTGDTLGSAPPVLPDDDVIEGYTLVEILGEGGQGVVYKADQHFPRRKVAIKFLRQGRRAPAAARRRFEREIAIAARLHHQNIVTIFDSGVMPDGGRFCVMEYIRGMPLSVYVREKKLNLVQTLELFEKVCDAVNFAHQRGVMHRDLKPSNILIDADGNVKVLDFGLARMVAEVDDIAVSTTGQVVGALPYLSPEQTRGNPDEIDIRTDVYSLGVVLYELLTGCYPYAVDCDWPDLITRIRETPPTPPSSAWSVKSGVRSGRELRPVRRLGRNRCPIDKEVETIILVCLRKERERRYQSAGELARDIRRYLNGEPIEAKRDSALYVLRKMLSQYRRSVMVAAAVVLLAAGGLFVGARYQEELRGSEVRRLEKIAVADFGRFGEIYSSASAPVKDRAYERCRELVFSEAFTGRTAGARMGLMVNPDAFWESIDGGPLWTYGEWLELCRMDWPDPAHVLGLLRDKAAAKDATDRRKYVAFCLIGQLGGDRRDGLDAQLKGDLVDLCRKAVNSESQPGVVSAARWAAMRLGETLVYPHKPGAIIVDEVSGMTFVRVPGCDVFRQGSDPDDPDRHNNEDKPGQGINILPFYLATTEVTVGQLAVFLKAPAYADLARELAANLDEHKADEARIKAYLLDSITALAESKDVVKHLCAMMRVPEGPALPQTAAGYISLDLARGYCEWLNGRSKDSKPTREYRLPEEHEWEYACRGGNEGRFCFGRDADYAAYFANCNGDLKSHAIGQRMPNWYGLSDMHGGLWELCGSRFPPELVSDSEHKKQELFLKRGGAFYSPAVRCRSAQRNYTAAGAIDYYTGVRLVLNLKKVAGS